MDRQKIAAVIVILVVIAAGLALFFANNGSTTSESTPAPKAMARSAAPATPAGKGSEASTVPTIRATSDGFSPATLTVAVGATVTITNDSSDTVSFASDPHPTHTDNPFLNIGNIEPGQSKTVKISKAGTLGYHDHLNASHTGTIVAQ